MTDKQKLAWLKKNKVLVKTETPSKSTIRRLYSFYQRNPLSTPRNLAYGMPKRIDRTLEKQGTLQTPKGAITAEDYIQTKSKKTVEEIQQMLPPGITWKTFDHRFKSGKREDRFRYIINHYQGLRITYLNHNGMLIHIKQNILPDLMETIKLYLKKRSYFYKTRTIGAIILYDTKNIPGDPIPRPVAFTQAKEFEEYLFDMLQELLITDIFRNYKDAIVTLKYIDIFIRTRKEPSGVEKLL